MSLKDNVLGTDVLVIGAGIAGCFAAIRAKEMGADVVMVEQGKSGFVGMSAVGTNITRAVLPDDDFEKAVEGAILESEYMVDQEYAAGAINETWDRFQELLNIGADFRRDDNGNLRWYLVDTPYPGFQQRVACWEPMSTHKHLLKVKTEAVRRGVRIIDRLIITDLLTSNGEVNGAVGFGTREGDLYIFKAKAVVITAGTFESGGRFRDPSQTGDGVAMALRAGAELRGMEFGKIQMAGIPPKSGGPTELRISVGLSDDDPIITNAHGEEFLEKYEATRKLPGRRYDGPPWYTHTSAMLQECRDGKGPCYVDYRASNKADRLRVTYGASFDLTLKKMKLSGVTLDQVKYEMGIILGGSQGGGIRITPQGESSLKGLFAGGVASDMCCAQHHSVPANLLGSHITGRRAGESAAKYALSQSHLSIDEEQLNRFREQIYAPLNRQRGFTEEEVRTRLVEPWVNIDLRSEARLKKAQEKLQELEQEAGEMLAEDYHQLIQCHKIKSYLQCVQSVVCAALERRETRLEHMREDYPLTDNINWLKWVIVSLVSGRLEARLEDIPIKQWKYKPESKVFNRMKLYQEVSL